MGLSVRIFKERETETHVFYRFGVAEKGAGRLSIRKADGWMEELVPAQHPQSRAIFVRAMHTLMDHWTAGELPDLTYWQGDDKFTS
jgi:hypothetical protein